MKVIAIVGIDGSGKSTLARKLTSLFARKNIQASGLNVLDIFASAPWIRHNRLLLGFYAFLSCLAYPMVRWWKRLRGVDVLLVEHCPHIELEIYAGIYGGCLGKIVRPLSHCFKKPDQVIHVIIDPQEACENIKRRGTPRQWHENMGMLRRLDVLLRKKTGQLQPIKAVFPAHAEKIFEKIKQGRST